ncbi:MAG: GNAT family N-acetyltransferase [Tissierellia bacterium]|nr:GNAT family N-acetyltransferase [Tissierellia bacterium]
MKDKKYMSSLVGDRIKMEIMIPEHLRYIKAWGVHEDILFTDYNISKMSYNNLKIWYSYRRPTRKTLYYSVFNEEDRMIGYIGIKDIRILRRTSYLGIAFDPNYIEMGYGSEALKLFLDYYFNSMDMKEIYLEVNAFNARALNLYRSMGFVQEGEFLGEFEVSLEDMMDDDIIFEPEYFTIAKGKLYSRIIRMRLNSFNDIKIPVRDI